jgi:hypothetical protein
VRSALTSLLLLAACASAEPLDVSLGAATEQIAVTVLGGGFVQSGGQRLPREAFVLALRQRVRAMPAEAVAGLRVEIGVASDSGDSGGQDAAWLIDQLYIMGIQQARYL